MSEPEPRAATVFRLTHRVCVAQLLLLWIQPICHGYRCVVFRCCNVNPRPQAVNRKENRI